MRCIFVSLMCLFMLAGCQLQQPSDIDAKQFRIVTYAHDKQNDMCFALIEGMQNSSATSHIIPCEKLEGVSSDRIYTLEK